MSITTSKLLVLIGVLLIGGALTKSIFALLAAAFIINWAAAFFFGANWAVATDARVKRLRHKTKYERDA